ncbi:hypothetical protein PR048_005378 [Dryococelus australis]|uniref:PiggyBac transposable element-derived protein domain-containing protein n=1 Tax=Dryococelus australis TaxID=614101 RepID=A0ABQ9I818_9NEOP|nr:hypothetical protein PR048_005378 [Dryococelus australis]
MVAEDPQQEIIRCKRSVAGCSASEPQGQVTRATICGDDSARPGRCCPCDTTQGLPVAACLFLFPFRHQSFNLCCLDQAGTEEHATPNKSRLKLCSTLCKQELVPEALHSLAPTHHEPSGFQSAPTPPHLFSLSFHFCVTPYLDLLLKPARSLSSPLRARSEALRSQSRHDTSEQTSSTPLPDISTSTSTPCRQAKTSRHHHHENYNSKTRKIQHWVDTSPKEIRAFFGILIVMGIHQLPYLRNYWSSDPILGVESVSNILNDNLEAKPNGMVGYDKFHKVRPLVKSLNENCSQTYHHSDRPSFDESMIPFKGRSGIKQYMPLKLVKKCYNIWYLAESVTGFVLKLEIYSGKTDSFDYFGLGERVILYLCSVLAYSKAIILLENRIYSIGSVRVNRKDLPGMLKTNDKLQ